MGAALDEADSVRRQRDSVEFARNFAKCHPVDTTQIVTTFDRHDAIRKREVTTTPKPFQPPPRVEFDLGLGYGEFNNIGVTVPARPASVTTVAAPAYELRGSVRELPSVTLYATYNFVDPKSPAAIHPALYVGLRTGVIQFQDGHVYTPAKAPDTTSLAAFGVSAQSLEFGGVPLGADFGILGGHLFAEVSRMTRHFGSLSYTPPSGVSQPMNFPRQLDYTGWSVDIGIQVPLPTAAGSAKSGNGS